LISVIELEEISIPNFRPSQTPANAFPKYNNLFQSLRQQGYSL